MVRTTPKALAQYARQMKALELRKAGHAYAFIAQQLGYKDAKVAWMAVNRVLEKAKVDEATNAKSLDLERLDVALESIWHFVQSGSAKHVMAMLAILERRAKLLGLDSPIKQEITGGAGGPLEITVEEPNVDRLQSIIGILVEVGVLPAGRTQEDQRLIESEDN